MENGQAGGDLGLDILGLFDLGATQSDNEIEWCMKPIPEQSIDGELFNHNHYPFEFDDTASDTYSRHFDGHGIEIPFPITDQNLHPGMMQWPQLDEVNMDPENEVLRRQLQNMETALQRERERRIASEVRVDQLSVDVSRLQGLVDQQRRMSTPASYEIELQFIIERVAAHEEGLQRLNYAVHGDRHFYPEPNGASLIDDYNGLSAAVRDLYSQISHLNALMQGPSQHVPSQGSDGMRE